MSEEPAFNPRLGSVTSGVDGSSEGGRIDTTRQPSSLSLYGVALTDRIRSDGYKSKVSFAPALVDGVWYLRVEYEGEEAPHVPETWHGHRVIVEPKPAEEPKPAAGGS